jgi:hypothetical protein
VAITCAIPIDIEINQLQENYLPLDKHRDDYTDVRRIAIQGAGIVYPESILWILHFWATLENPDFASSLSVPSHWGFLSWRSWSIVSSSFPRLFGLDP